MPFSGWFGITTIFDRRSDDSVQDLLEQFEV